MRSERIRRERSITAASAMLETPGVHQTSKGETRFQNILRLVDDLRLALDPGDLRHEAHHRPLEAGEREQRQVDEEGSQRLVEQPSTRMSSSFGNARSASTLARLIDGRLAAASREVTRSRIISGVGGCAQSLHGLDFHVDQAASPRSSVVGQRRVRRRLQPPRLLRR